MAAGRPKKNNAEYFSHDATMRNDAKIKALRRKFFHIGYAVWNMLLEAMTQADHFKLKWETIDVELIAGDFDIDPEKLQEIVDYCIILKLLQKEENYLICAKLSERFSPLIEYREKRRKIAESGNYARAKYRDDVIMHVQNTENTKLCTGKNTHSIVKESIVKDNIKILSKKNKKKKEVNDNPKFLAFQKWIEDHAPRVAKMKEPITAEQYERISIELDPKQVAEILQAMHNYEPLLKKNRNANLTLRNWLKKRNENGTTTSTNQSRYPSYTERLRAESEESKRAIVDDLTGNAPSGAQAWDV